MTIDKVIINLNKHLYIQKQFLLILQKEDIIIIIIINLFN